MLCIFTLIIVHKSCNISGILNKLTLQKELQNYVTKNCVSGQKVKTQQQQNKTSNIKKLAGAKNWTRDLSHPKRMRYLCTTESIVVKLFNCFDAMGRNLNKLSRICGPYIFKFFFFSVVFLHAWITILGSFFFYRSMFHCLNMLEM